MPLLRRAALLLGVSLLASLFVPPAVASATYDCYTMGDSPGASYATCSMALDVQPGDVIRFYNNHPLNSFQEVIVFDATCPVFGACPGKLAAWGHNGYIGSFVVPSHGYAWVAWVLDVVPPRPFAVFGDPPTGYEAFGIVLRATDQYSQSPCQEANVNPTQHVFLTPTDCGRDLGCYEPASGSVDAPAGTTPPLSRTPLDAYGHACADGTVCGGQRTNHDAYGRADYSETCANDTGDRPPVCTRSGEYTQAPRRFEETSSTC